MTKGKQTSLYFSDDNAQKPVDSKVSLQKKKLEVNLELADFKIIII